MFNFNLRLVLIVLAIGLIFVACGGNKQQENTEATPEVVEEVAESQEGDWPDNEYTKQVPKPDITIYSADDGPNGFNVDFPGSTTIEEIKVYADKVKDAGFNQNIYVEDEDGRFNFNGFNAAGWRVIVSKAPGVGSFMII
ncbi:MAG: hypothetical protein FWG85_05840, partial [Bacteroidetes bacterium]|nr:hypothetical protein [Bacteroidota bacterium]